AQLGELGAAEEVPPADDDRDLDTPRDRIADLGGDTLDHVGREPDTSPAEGLARQLEQHAPRARHLVHRTSWPPLDLHRVRVVPARRTGTTQVTTVLRLPRGSGRSPSPRR